MRFVGLSLVLLLTALTGRAQYYLFYLHGRIVEEQGAQAVDHNNGFGAYEYNNIVAAFKKEGFTVISEVRPKNTDPDQYAQKVKHQVDSLLHKGVKPAQITVLGSSKGSAIAMRVSTLLSNPDVNFVFMSACSESGDPAISFCGNILSIYEKSDTWAQSCSAQKKLATRRIPHYREIELNTGLRHGYLYKPLPEWIKPATDCAHGKYN